MKIKPAQQLSSCRCAERTCAMLLRRHGASDACGHFSGRVCVGADAGASWKIIEKQAKTQLTDGSRQMAAYGRVKKKAVNETGTGGKMIWQRKHLLLSVGLRCA